MDRSYLGCAAAALLLSSWGCGARTGLAGSDDAEPAPEATSAPVDPVPTTDEPPAGDMGGFLGGSRALPPCRPGVARAEAMRCKFTFNDLCYDTATEACACACPPNITDTLCAQGIPDDTGTAEIKYCIPK